MSAEHEGREVAQQYRHKHYLGTQPLGDLVALIDLVEKIDVAIIRAPADDAHGITVRDPRNGTAMLIATTTNNPTRLRSTIAHELAHHLFADQPPNIDEDARPREEVRADAFARHLLLPIEALADILGPADAGRTIDTSDVSALVQRFGLSPQMVAIQLCIGRYISETQKDEWMASLSSPRLATRFGWSNLYANWQASSQTVRPPQRLLARAIRGYAQGIVSIETIARIEGTDPATAREALSDAGIQVQAETAELADLGDPKNSRTAEALAAFDAEFGDDA